LVEEILGIPVLEIVAVTVKALFESMDIVREAPNVLYRPGGIRYDRYPRTGRETIINDSLDICRIIKLVSHYSNGCIASGWGEKGSS